jgi:hypothetical protein
MVRPAPELLLQTVWQSSFREALPDAARAAICKKVARSSIVKKQYEGLKKFDTTSEGKPDRW